MRHLRRLAAVAALLVATSTVLGVEEAAAATSVSSVTFTSTAPTSVVANAASTWTIGFTTSSSGGLSKSGTVTVTFPLGFNTASTTPTVSLLSGFSSCTATASDASKGAVVIVTLAGTSCSLSSSTAGSLSLAVLNGDAGTYGGANFTVATSADKTAAAATSSETLTPTAVTSVTVNSTAPTSVVESAASTWTWGFTTSATGSLASSNTITLTFPAGFATVTTTPVVALTSPATFVSTCSASAADGTETNVVVLTLANNGSSTCALGASTAATLTVGVVNGTSDPSTSFSLATSQDVTPTSPSSSPTLSSATKLSSVTFTTTAPTSLTANSSSTWTVGFTPSYSGDLGAGAYVVVQLPSGFTTSTTTPTVTALSPSTFVSDCAVSGSDPTEANVVVITLANLGSSTCTLDAFTAATISIAVVNGPAGTYGATSYAAWTSVDGTTASPSSGSETLAAAVPGSGTAWAATLSDSGGEAQAGAKPSTPASPKGAQGSGDYLCASSSTEQVVLQWTAVPHATSYTVEDASSASGTYSALTGVTFTSATSASITFTTSGTEYFKVIANIGSEWKSSTSAVAVDGGVSSGYVVTSTSSPECTDN